MNKCLKILTWNKRRLEVLQMFFGCAKLNNKKSDFPSL